MNYWNIFNLHLQIIIYGTLNELYIIELNNWFFDKPINKRFPYGISKNTDFRDLVTVPRVAT